MRKTKVWRGLVIFLMIIAIIGSTSSVALARIFRVSFASPVIEIIAPHGNKMVFNGGLTTEGETRLEQIWLAVRGPQNEIVVHPVEVIEGRFQTNIELRFGPGTYTIWAGDSPRRFDGRIRFQVVNDLEKDTRYLAASAFVDSNHPAIIALANSLVTPEMSEIQKLEALHRWVIENIRYDYQAFLRQENILVPASHTMATGLGMCRDYSFLLAALCRAAGLPARVVYGQVRNHNGWNAQLHAWNQVLVNEEWVTVDATWNAGHIRSGAFVASPSSRFFATGAASFSLTHHKTIKTLH